MLTNLKVFATVVAVGGGFIGVPVTLWQANFLATAQPKIRTIMKTLSKAKKTNSKQGNCNVERLSAKNESFLLSQEKKDSFYVEILCDTTSIGNSGAGALSSDWTGLFPAQLLSNGEKLSIEEKLNLETEDATKNETVKTIFKGAGVKKTITGTWGEETIAWNGESIRPVSFPENPNIKNKLYLIFH